MVSWLPLETLEKLDEIYQQNDEINVIFKHSTRCPVSSMAKRNLEYDSDLIPTASKFYFLDLIKYRSISNRIAELWGVRHESPQVLVVQGDRLLYDASHSDIEMQSIVSFIS